MKPIRLLVTFLSCISLTSCIDSIEPPEINFLQCDSNCYKLKVSGQIINNLTNNGIPDTRLTLSWDKVICFFCSEKIDTTYSNNEGYYSFDVFIDTSYFTDGYFLLLQIPKESTYLHYSDPFRNFIREVPDTTDNIINFYLQPAAKLEIHLNRIEKDTFNNMSVSYYYYLETSYEHKSFTYSIDSLNQIIYGRTVAGLKTYITWKKELGEIIHYGKDSIICKQNERNIFQLNY